MRVPYTLIAHGIDVGTNLSQPKVAALREADQILAVSAWTRSRLLSLDGIDPGRIALLPNTFDGSRFNPGPSPAYLIERYGIERGERVILTVARLGPTATLAGYKGCDRVLTALPAIVRAVGKVRYLIVGTGPDQQRLENIARTQGIAGHVTFAGFIPDAELADHYRLADVFVMPSKGEGFGIVFLEAMACGTPVVAGNVDGSVDALDNGRLGALVDPDDIGALASSLTDLLEQKGPPLWFDREGLSREVVATFGRDAFRARLAEVLAC